MARVYIILTLILIPRPCVTFSMSSYRLAWQGGRVMLQVSTYRKIIIRLIGIWIPYLNYKRL